MESFNISENLVAVCEWKKTRSGFKHEATLLMGGRENETVKICYLNRTWEAFEYQDVLYKLLDKTRKRLTPEEVAAFEHVCKHGSGRPDPVLSAVSMAAAFGALIHGDDQSARNDWNKRMIAAGLGASGVSFPEDWETLSEDEKERRLNEALNAIRKEKPVARKCPLCDGDLKPTGDKNFPGGDCTTCGTYSDRIEA